MRVGGCTIPPIPLTSGIRIRQAVVNQVQVLLRDELQRLQESTQQLLCGGGSTEEVQLSQESGVT